MCSVCFQASRKEAREAKLENMRNGKSNNLKKPAAVKKIGKDFIAALRKDHDYQGADYEVFSNWLGQDSA